MKTNTLYVDAREPKQIFDKIIKSGIEYVKGNIPVGDFIYNDWVFERKTVDDCLASIFSGRLYEQVNNMKNNFDNVVVVISGLANDNDTKIIRGIIASLMAKHDIKVTWCPSDDDLVKLIVRICQKTHETVNANIKRLRTTTQDVHLMQILCVPGIGNKNAKLIYNKYKPIQLYNTTIEQLMTIPGIGKTTAMKIKKVFNDDN